MRQRLAEAKARVHHNALTRDAACHASAGARCQKIAHFADHVFFSVKAIAATGMLTEADPLEAEVKRTMIGQAGARTLLVDRSKLAARGLTAIAPVTEIACVLGADLTPGEVAALRSHGVQVRTVESAAAAEPAAS